MNAGGAAAGECRAAEARGLEHICRVILGGVLVVAAALKIHQVATEPAIDAAVFNSPWLLVAAAQIELLVALLLIVNPFPTWTSRIGVAFFASSSGTCVSDGTWGCWFWGWDCPGTCAITLVAPCFNDPPSFACR
jgi:hypothetical protein